MAMRKNDSFYGPILMSDQDEQSDDDSPRTSSPPRSRGGSYSQTAAWPQSYRHSIDAYSSLASPSFLSPAISRLTPSYISDSILRKRKTAEHISPPDTEALLLHKDEGRRKEESVYDPSLILPPEKKLSVGVIPGDLHAPAARGCSATQAVLNGVNVLCGVGVLSTPYALSQGGWLGLGILFLFAIVSWYTGILLRRCLDSRDGIATYPDIGQAAFGKMARLLISVVLYVELYACCVEFLILEGDNLSSIFPNANISINGVDFTSMQLCTIAATVLILPTVWIRELSVLSYVSAGGVIASVVVFFCVAWIGVVDGVGFHKSGPLLNLSNLPVAIGLYGFCFSGHAVFPNIYTSLKDPSKFTMVLTISFIVCGIMYGGMAIMGFTMFGDETESQITLNLPGNLIVSKIAVWTTIVNPFTKYALTMTPVALSLEELIPSAGHGLPNFWISMGIRTGLVLSTLCVAVLVPFFAYVMSFIGSFLSMLVCLILPAACFLKIVGKEATMLQICFCTMIVAIGIACAITGTYSSVLGIIQSFTS